MLTADGRPMLDTLREQRLLPAPNERRGGIAMRVPPTLLDEIRAALPVSQIVGRHVKLRRQGREYAGLSPFKHGEDALILRQ